MSQAQATSGGSLVRASDAERDQAAEILRAGYAEGRLGRAELDERIAAAYAAKTRADLRDLTSDLPGAASAPAAGDHPAPAVLPILDPESGTGPGPNWCLLLCLLFAFPPAGIIYWILTARRQPRPGAGQPMPTSPTSLTAAWGVPVDLSPGSTSSGHPGLGGPETRLACGSGLPGASGSSALPDGILEVEPLIQAVIDPREQLLDRTGIAPGAGCAQPHRTPGERCVDLRHRITGDQHLQHVRHDHRAPA